MDRPGFITPSLCRGLAQEGLAALEAQRARFASGLRTITPRRLKTKKQLRHAVGAFARLGEAAHLIQVIGQTPNERDALISQFVPYVMSLDDGSDRKQL